MNNITKTWEGIKNIVNIKKTSIRTTQLKIGGKIIDNDKEIATNFNKVFVNVGPNTENTIPKVPNLSPSKFVIAHVSNEEVLDIINSLENKSTGPSSIPLRMLSIIPDLIILPLANIILVPSLLPYRRSTRDLSVSRMSHSAATSDVTGQR